MEKHHVEVCGLNGAFYQAHIQSISEETLEVVYDNNPELQFAVPYDCVRQLPPHSYFRMVVGAEVEVYSSTSHGEPFGWWLAQIRMAVGEWFLVEYQAGGQEFVLPGAIRSCNRDRCGSIETVVRSYRLKQERASLQVTEQSHTVEKEDFPEELWESEEGRPDWHLTLEAPPPKVKKPNRRRRQKGKRPCVEYTMEDEFDDEEIRLTPQGNRLYRLFGSRWVEMK